MFSEDTIAAISTPFGVAGIGKIRISGPGAIEIADRLFQGVTLRNLSEARTYTAHYGHVIDPETGKIADEVVAILMRKPHSFTGEDVVEFDCHGGIVPLERVLGLILGDKARLAEPGEFSRRAFLNGRLDLAQAEAIIEVINSRTEKSLDIALDHLNGKLSERIYGIREQVLGLLAHLEASIDFPEDEIEGFTAKLLGQRIEKIKDDILQLLETTRQGKIYREGINTVIVGKPNVGKSSLLNTLLEEKRAIVTDLPGTTRDIIEEYINIQGLPLKIIDTAGIRETHDLIEKIGVDRARSTLEKADLILLMLDVSQGLTQLDLEIYDLIRNKPVIVVVNKTDLKKKIRGTELKRHFPGHTLLKISIKEEKGLKELKQAIIDEVIKEELKGDEVLITRARHKDALEQGLKAIERVINSHQQELPVDFLTIDLKDCLTSLGRITGETVTDDIIDRIFADFCLGK